MTVILFPRSENLSQNDTAVWQDKLTASGPITEGQYMIIVSLEYGGTNTEKGVAVRLVVDGEEQNMDQHTPDIANTPKVVTMFWGGFLSAGNHSMQVQFKAVSTPQTALCRRARAVVQKH
jgi:hypothetical protein